VGDIEQNITLTAIGGDQAGAEISKTTSALGGVTQMSHNMEEAFSHRFTHIGLQVFGQDLLRTSGLGTEARQIIGTLQMGIMSASSAFGAAAGPIMLVAGGLTAVVGITMKVIDAHKAEAESIQKLIDAHTLQKKAYDDDISALTKYAAAGGAMTSALSGLLTAEKALSADLKENLLVNQEKEIEALEKQRAQIAQQQAVHQVWTSAMNAAKNAIAEIANTIGNMLIPGISLFGAAVGTLIAHLQSMVASVGQHVILTGQFKQKYDELTAAIDKMRVTHSQTAKGVVTDFATMQKAAEQHKELVIGAFQAEMNLRRSLQQADDDWTLQSMDNRMNAWIKNQQQMTKEQQKQLDLQQKQAEKIFNQIGSDFGNAFAQMIVEGKSFTEQMQQAFTRMAEQIISDLVRIIMEQELLFMWQSMTGTVGSGNLLGGGGGGFGGMFATGGSVVVDKPTMFMAGEGGPEIASFTPVGQAGGGDSGGSGGSVGNVQITLNVDHIQGNDPSGTLDMLSDQIRRETVSGRRFASTVAGVAARYPNMAY
jgi:hypothetical protein